MKILARLRGEETEHDIPRNDSGITAVVMRPGIKVTAPDAYEISSDTTVKCMKEMSQKAWEHISTGELFQHLFKILFGQDAWIPKTIDEMNEEDVSAIHGAGLIIQLVEARFNHVTEVHLRTPENHFHPKQTRMLMSVVVEIQKIPMGGFMNVTSSPSASGDLDYGQAINNAIKG